MRFSFRLMVSNAVALLALSTVTPYFATAANTPMESRLAEIEQILNTSSAKEPQLLEEISKIIESNPTNGKAHLLAGRILERNGFNTLAVQEFDKADKYSPRTADALLESFLIKLEQNDPRGAADYVRYIAKRFPNDPSLALTRALLMESQGRTEFSEAFLKKALDGKDKRFGIATAVGQIRLRQGKPEEALALAQYDLAKRPDNFRANYLAGQACTKLKRFKEGASYYGKAYQTNAGDDRFLTEYASDLLRSGMYNEALQPALMNMAVQTAAPKLHQAKTQVATLVERTTQEQVLSAVEAVSKRIDGTIYQGRFYLALGDVFDHTGKRSLAEEYYARGIEQLPNMGRPYYRLAKDLQQDQKYEEAKTLYQRAYSLEPDDAQVAAGYLRFGMRYVNRNNDLAWLLKDAIKKKFQ